MAKVAYNDVKNISTNHKPFELSYGYHPQASYKEDINPQSQSKKVDKIAIGLKKRMTVCKENLYHAKKLQKQHFD